MKIATIIGARPQFIKAAMVSREIRARGAGVREVVVHTGQHFDANMSDVFFQQLDLEPPDRNLGVAGGSHASMTARMLVAIEAVLVEERPDWVLVYGDTNSTLAGALAAAKLKLPIAHVEAGLRCFDKTMPEEINRVVTDHLAALLFAPTGAAVANLRREALANECIEQVGDVMYDAALLYGPEADRSRTLDDLDLEPRGYVLATVHRAANTDRPEPLQSIMEGLSRIALTLPVVLPLHPRTRGALEKYGLLDRTRSRLRVIEPVGYLQMLALERHAAVIATDSGGVQKEAYFHGVPCITLRDTTEWVELVEVGANLVVGRDPAAIAAGFEQARTMRVSNEPLFGNGRTATAIVDRLAATATRDLAQPGSPVSASKR